MSGRQGGALKPKVNANMNPKMEVECSEQMVKIEFKNSKESLPNVQ